MLHKLFPIAIGLVGALLLAVAVAVASPDAMVRVAGSFVSLPNEETTITTTTPITGQDKIALAIARAFNVPVQDVLAVRNQNMGWGEVEKVFALAKVSGKTPAQIMAMRQQGLGWGEIEKQLGVHPGAGVNLGQTIKANKDHQTPVVHPDDSKSSQADDDKDTDDDHDKNQDKDHANDQDQDHGKDGDHTQDKDHDKGHDKDDHKPNSGGKDNGKHKGK